MKRPTRVAIVVVILAVLLIVAGCAVTLLLFKSGGRTEGPDQLALLFSR